MLELANVRSRAIDPDDSHRLSPERGNVAFASAQMGWCFTLKTFAAMYSDTFGSFDVDEFAPRLWGNIYFDSARRKFTRKPTDVESKRSFVHFILEPLYKLYTQVSQRFDLRIQADKASQVLSEDSTDLKATLAELRITLKPALFKLDVRPLLRVVCEAFFGPSTGLVDMITQHLPSPVDNAANKVCAFPVVLLCY